MNRGKYAPLLCLSVALIAITFIQPAIAQTYINEIAWDCGGNDAEGEGHLGGDDNRDEYIELRGTPGMSLANHYLIFIEAENDDTNTGTAGKIENIFDLNGRTLGANGFLTLRQKGNFYDTHYGGVAPGTTDLVNFGVGAGYGSGAGSSIGHSALEDKTNVENGGWTAMLIRNNGDPVAAMPVLDLDLDEGNDGLDPVDPMNPNHWRSNWTIVDSIGMLAEGAEPLFGRTYAPLTFGTLEPGVPLFPGGPPFNPNIEPGAQYVFAPWANVEGEIEYIGRWGNSTGQAPADWHIANVTQRKVAGAANGAPDYRISAEPHATNPGEQPPPGATIETNQNVPYGAPIFHTLGQSNYPLIVDGSLPGDYDENGVVDAADYVVWRNYMDFTGTVKLANEGDTPGKVTEEDYIVWRTHFGQALPGVAAGFQSHAVPEPASWLIGVLAIFSMTFVRRKGFLV